MKPSELPAKVTAPIFTSLQVSLTLSWFELGLFALLHAVLVGIVISFSL